MFDLVCLIMCVVYLVMCVVMNSGVKVRVLKLIRLYVGLDG